MYDVWYSTYTYFLLYTPLHSARTIIFIRSYDLPDDGPVNIYEHKVHGI